MNEFLPLRICIESFNSHSEDYPILTRCAGFASLPILELCAAGQHLYSSANQSLGLMYKWTIAIPFKKESSNQEPTFDSLLQAIGRCAMSILNIGIAPAVGLVSPYYNRKYHQYFDLIQKVKNPFNTSTSVSSPTNFTRTYIAKTTEDPTKTEEKLTALRKITINLDKQKLVETVCNLMNSEVDVKNKSKLKINLKDLRSFLVNNMVYLPMLTTQEIEGLYKNVDSLKDKNLKTIKNQIKSILTIKHWLKEKNAFIALDQLIEHIKYLIEDRIKNKGTAYRAGDDVIFRCSRKISGSDTQTFINNPNTFIDGCKQAHLAAAGAQNSTEKRFEIIEEYKKFINNSANVTKSTIKNNSRFSEILKKVEPRFINAVRLNESEQIIEILKKMENHFLTQEFNAARSNEIEQKFIQDYERLLLEAKNLISNKLNIREVILKNIENCEKFINSYKEVTDNLNKLAFDYSKNDICLLGDILKKISLNFHEENLDDFKALREAKDSSEFMKNLNTLNPVCRKLAAGLLMLLHLCNEKIWIQADGEYNLQLSNERLEQLKKKQLSALLSVAKDLLLLLCNRNSYDLIGVDKSIVNAILVDFSKYKAQIKKYAEEKIEG